LIKYLILHLIYFIVVEQVLLTVDALFKWFSEIRCDAASSTGKYMYTIIQ